VEDLENKLGAMLNDPQTMQKIMAMAQTLGQQQSKESDQTTKKEAPASEHAGFPLPDIDLGVLQKIIGISGKSSVDKNQKALLNALGPYLSRERIVKLERAMRAAKMANIASALLSGR